jgi:aspartyl-tRNA synthetase
MRSNGCGDLRKDSIDAVVQLCGWVDRRRDHGGVIFIDLRDRSGTVQITVDPDLGAEAFAVAEHLRSETVLQVHGKVRARPLNRSTTNSPPGPWRSWPARLSCSTR